MGKGLEVGRLGTHHKTAFLEQRVSEIKLKGNCPKFLDYSRKSRMHWEESRRLNYLHTY